MNNMKDFLENVRPCNLPEHKNSVYSAGYNPPPEDNSEVRPSPTPPAPKSHCEPTILHKNTPSEECKHEWMAYQWSNLNRYNEIDKQNIYSKKLSKVICKHCLEIRDV